MADSTSFQQQNGGKLSSTALNHPDATGHFSEPINQLLKPLSPTRTDAETELSSNQSHACGARDQRGVRSLSDTPDTCMGCFLSMVKSGEEQHHNDCFIAIDCSSSLVEPGYNISFLDATTREVASGQTFPLPITILTAPEFAMARLTPRTVHSKEVSEAKYGATMASTSNTLHRRSDISHMGLFTAQTLDAIYSGPSEVIEEDAGTPYDRDSQRDVGTASKGVVRPKYHTPAQRERIDSDSFRRTMEVVTCEKRSDDSRDSDVSSIALDAFFSPTLEESNGEENDIVESTTPVQLPASSSRKRLAFDSGGSAPQYDTPSHPIEETAGRNLFQLSSPMTISKQRASPLSAFGISVMSSLQCVMKVLQSIVRGSRRRRSMCRQCRRKHRSRHSNTSTLIDETKTCSTPGEEKHMPKGLQTMSLPPTSILKNKQHVDPSWRRAGGQWEDTFLQKSSTFLKELRRSGHRGEVIIHGWVAFRAGNVASWDRIIVDPKRSDFRYIILLEKTLHFFKSRNNRKKKTENLSSTLLVQPPRTSDAVLHECMSLNLTAGDIALRIHLVSKEYGNEVCIFNPETEEVQCSLLPMPMPPSIFLDRHKSRLGKGEVLKRVFHEPFFKDTSNSSGGSSILTASTNTDNDVIGTSKASISSTPPAVTASATTSDDEADEVDNDLALAPTEQYDVSRHVLFAIDAAIQISTSPLLPSLALPPMREAESQISRDAGPCENEQ